MTRKIESRWLSSTTPPGKAITACGGLAELQRVARRRALLGPLDVSEVPVPHDCRDGFLCAYWRRPERCLEAPVRAAISAFAFMQDAERGLTRLQADLKSGAWLRRYEHVLEHDDIALGYKLVVAEASASAGHTR